MANDVSLNLRITGNGKDAQAAIQQVVNGLTGLGITAQREGKKVESVGKSVGTFADSAKNSLRNLGGNLLGALGVAQFGALTRQLVSNVEELSNLSDETGISTQNLQVFQLAAQRSGLEVVAFQLALRQLANQLRAVQQGNVTAGESFRQVGLSGAELAKLPLDQALLKYANALQQFANDGNKLANVSDVLGGRSSKLLATLNALAGDGFAKTATEAQRLGLILREQAVRDLLALDDTLDNVKAQTDGLALSFAQGLAPGVAQALNAFQDTTTGTNTLATGFRAVGEALGFFLKLIVVSLDAIISPFNLALFTVANTVSGLIDAGRALGQDGPGGFSKFRDAINGIFSKPIEFAKASGEDSLEKYRVLFGKPEEITGAAVEARETAIRELQITQAALAKAGKPAANIDVTKLSTAEIVALTQRLGNELKRTIQIQQADLNAVLKAQADERLAQLDRELALVKAKSEAVTAAAAASFADGQQSIAQFFAGRRATLEAEAAAEISVARRRVAELAQAEAKQRAIRAGSPDALQAQTATRNAQNALTLLGIQYDARRVALVIEETQKREELNQSRRDFERQILEAQGQTTAAALLGIDQQVEALTKNLQQLGVSTQEIADRAGQFRNAATLKIQLEDLTSQADALTASIGLNQERLSQLVDQGVLTADQAALLQTRFIGAQVGSAERLQGLVDTLRAQTTDPTQLAALDAIATKLGGIQTAALGATTQLDLFGQQALSQGGRALLSLFSDLASGADSVGASFKKFALTVVKAFGDIAAQILVLQAITAVARAFGVPIPSGGFRFATGGPVPGVGNGDTVPAMLTPGEYVLNKQQVAEVGGFAGLERWRRSLRSGFATQPVLASGRAYFAEGGPVEASTARQLAGPQASPLVPAAGGETRVVVEVRPPKDWLARELEANPRAVVKVVGQNKNGVNDALGRK